MSLSSDFEDILQTRSVCFYIPAECLSFNAQSLPQGACFHFPRLHRNKVVASSSKVEVSKERRFQYRQKMTMRKRPKMYPIYQLVGHAHPNSHEEFQILIHLPTYNVY